MEVTQRYRQCNYDLERRTIRSYPQSVVEREWHPLKQPGVDFAVCTLGNFRSNWTMARHGVNWHRGVF